MAKQKQAMEKQGFNGFVGKPQQVRKPGPSEPEVDWSTRDRHTGKKTTT